MGANLVNSICEAIAPDIAALCEGEIALLLAQSAAVLETADALLVPVIPTTLSLRALRQLRKALKDVKGRRRPALRLGPRRCRRSPTPATADPRC